MAIATFSSRGRRRMGPAWAGRLAQADEL